MNRLRPDRRAEVLLMLCQGASMRGVARASGVSVNTAAKLLVDAGGVCQRLHDSLVRDLRVPRVECYKSWSRDCGTAEGIWTWSAVAADSDLIITWTLGGLDAAAASAFVADVGARTGHPDLRSTDIAALCADNTPFSLDLATGVRGAPAADKPGVGKRIEKRRFTRLRNAYSRTFSAFAHMVALYTFWSNFMRTDGNGATAAMAAGLAERPWTPGDVFALIDA